MTQQEKITRGEKVFEAEQKLHDDPFRQADLVRKIRYHEYFTSGHDDTAVTISLLDADGNTLWKTKITDDFEADAWALKAYLQDRFRCPVEEIEL